MTYNNPLTERLLSLYFKDFNICRLLICSAFIFSSVLTLSRYIEVDFTFGLPCYVRYIEEFVISRFIISRFYPIHFTVTLAGT